MMVIHLRESSLIGCTKLRITAWIMSMVVGDYGKCKIKTFFCWKICGQWMQQPEGWRTLHIFS